MKKTMLLPVFLLATITASFAQGGFISFGIKGGVNLSNVTMGDVQVKSLVSSSGINDILKANEANLIGYHGGGFIKIGRKFFVQPEFLFSTKGGSFDVVKNGVLTKTDVRFSNVDIPLLFGLKSGFLRINAGPMASINVSDNATINDVLKAYTSQPLSETIKKSTFGYQAGVGIDIGSFMLDIRYEGSLKGIVDTQLYNSTNTNIQPTQFTQKTTLWQISLGFRLM